MTGPLVVACKYCHAPIGQPCINSTTKQPVQNFDAHQIRIADALHKYQPPDDDGIPF